jgi:hypothetical protein
MRQFLPAVKTFLLQQQMPFARQHARQVRHNIAQLLLLLRLARIAQEQFAVSGTRLAAERAGRRNSAVPSGFLEKTGRDEHGSKRNQLGFEHQNGLHEASHRADEESESS